MRSIGEFVEDLRKQGYSVKFDATVKGKSGATHHVDLLAEHPRRKRIVGLEKRGNETALEIINTYVVSYDIGGDACYIVDRELDDENRKLIEHYKITLLTRV